MESEIYDELNLAKNKILLKEFKKNGTKHI